MPDGLIVKALSGYYYVLPDGEEPGQDGQLPTVQCRARGVFKKRSISPLVGDRVSFEHSENNEGTVTEIHKRQSELIRPPVANIEQAVLVFSLDEPALNLQLLDKFLVHIEHSGLEAVICFSKQDLVKGDGDGADQLDSSAVQKLYEEIGYRVFITSAKEGEGLEPVRHILKERLSVFSGQSGVGKSTLLNALLPELNLETGEISMRLGRGRHTTRHVELLALPDGGWVADTPGFSQLDFMEMEPEDLGGTFREFLPLAEECRFRGCLHHKEPGCRVREEAEGGGRVAPSRYEHYLIFLQEMKDRKRRY
ncbi:ribosome small subunit-dependent GTPase A [Paenibacillus mesotrionivorans]|uniref:Ribosome small subunit-dependent GTPase A n=1 Tax=Paenibacillus mesotrionivorans TaxID=3160968 RepID=A0ACC7NZL1_9BACL